MQLTLDPAKRNSRHVKDQLYPRPTAGLAAQDTSPLRQEDGDT